MSRCPQALWDSFLAPMPMPADCTMQQYLAAQRALDDEEHRAWSTKFLKQLITDRRHLLQKMDESQGLYGASVGVTYQARLDVLDALIRNEVGNLRGE